MINTNNKLKPAVGYCRFSSSLQREESIDAQKRAIEKYCDFYGFEIVEWYCDEAKSGTNTKRPEFQRLVADIKEGKVKTLIVHKIDRFSRNTIDTLKYINLCVDYDVAFISVSEKIDGSTPSGKMSLTMVASFNEYFVENLRSEVMKGLTENAYNCVWTGGPPPLGYDLNNKQLVINEKEAEVVRLIFEMCAEGYGYGKIIDRLNTFGYKTKKGQKFGKNSLYDLISNERYKGVFIFNRRSGKSRCEGKRNNHKYKAEEEIIRIPNGCPAIVSEELWNKANATRKITGKYKTNAKRPYLLTGFLYCEDCGAKMHGNIRYSSKGYSYMTYRCNNRFNNHSCTSKEIKTVYVDNFVIDELFKAFFTDEALDELTVSINEHRRKMFYDDEKYRKAKETREANARMLDILVDALAESDNSPKICERIKLLEKEIANANEFINNYKTLSDTPITKEQIKDNLEDFKSRLIESDCIEQTKLMLSKVIDKIVIGDKRIKLYLKLPNPDTSENNKINLSDNPMIIGKVFLRKDIESADGIEITIKDWETFWDELRMKYKECC